MQITMVGTGYVGLVTGVCYANTGNAVTCLDIDQAKIDRLNREESPIFEPGLETLIRRNRKAGRLIFTTDHQSAYRSAEVIFISVGTPPGADGHADLTTVFTVAREIGQALEAAPGATGGETDDAPEKIVVVKSTVPVGTNAKVQQEIAAHTAKPFHMASCPEFMKEGDAIHDFSYPDRVIVGVHDKYSAEKLRDLHEPFVRQGNPIFVMDVPSAEMVKYASNCMLATKISFINEIANLCEGYGADVDEVRRGMCSDQRIGRQFFYPGLGFGGSCFPKDVLACISMGRESGTVAQVLESVHTTNLRQRDLFFKKIQGHFKEGLRGKTLAVWGLAFKPGTDDIREAPAITLIRRLLDNQANVRAYDPVAAENAAALFGDRITLVDDPMDVLDGVDGLIICTNWGEFLHPEFDQMRQRMNQPVIFDGRNIYRLDQMAELGFTYYSIGRKTVHA